MPIPEPARRRSAVGEIGLYRSPSAPWVGATDPRAIVGGRVMAAAPAAGATGASSPKTINAARRGFGDRQERLHAGVFEVGVRVRQSARLGSGGAGSSRLGKCGLP